MISCAGERGVRFSLPGFFVPRSLLMAMLIGYAGVTFLPAPCLAARKPDFRLLKATELPSIGLKINVMPGSRETPLPPPSIFTYTFTQGTRSWKSDMYAPYDLWIQSQQAARWQDEHGNTLTLATVTLPLPKGFPMPHVTKEDYDKKVNELQKAQTPWTPEALSQWAADFAGVESVKTHAVAKRPMSLQDLVMFSLDGQPNRLLYAFRLNRSGAGQSKAVSTWFLALFDINPEIAMESALSTINTEFIGKMTSSKTPAPASPGPSKTFQTVPTSGKVARSPEFIASRDLVAGSIKNMKDWWYVETANYIILSNMKAKHRIMVKQLQEDIEYLRAAFEQFMPPRLEVTAVSVIRVFAEPNEYEAYVPANFAWSSGIWMSDKKELVIRPADFGGNKEQREAVLHTVYHEAFHQYIFYALDEFPTMPWFNEGYATFFGTANIGNRKLAVEEDPRLAKILEERLASGPLDLESFLHLSYEEFYAKDVKLMEQNYALAWALVYYLRKSAVLEKPAPYAAILDKYCEAIWKTRDPEKATGIAFEGIDPGRFQQDFLKFWKSKSKRSAASRNRIFKDYNPTETP